MSLKIVRNDITRMECDAIVNTANEKPMVGSGCDHAIYMAAGFDELLAYRKEKIGEVPEGEVFITPAFKLKAKYIIHAVSPHFIDGNSGEEGRLRSCYHRSLALACENGVKSIAFPLIATGSFGYPMEEGLRIAADEINAFLLKHPMLVYIVVFDDRASTLGRNIDPDLESYIGENYVCEKEEEEYSPKCSLDYGIRRNVRRVLGGHANSIEMPSMAIGSRLEPEPEEREESKLEERIGHLSDTFSEYLLYLIKEKGLTNAEVYNKALVDKKVFSKIKNNPDYHPQKITALCLCVGARLNLDEAKDLLARAGYALSPCIKTDVIFSYFIENEIYDMIELDIVLEEHGEKCIIQ